MSVDFLDAMVPGPLQRTEALSLFHATESITNQRLEELLQFVERIETELMDLQSFSREYNFDREEVLACFEALLIKIRRGSPWTEDPT